MSPRVERLLVNAGAVAVMTVVICAIALGLTQNIWTPPVP